MLTDPASADLLSFPSRPADRLRRALRRLDAALADQGAAVAGFRADLAALSGAVAGLDASAQAYRDRLAEAADAAHRAHLAARRLAALAETMQRK